MNIMKATVQRLYPDPRNSQLSTKRYQIGFRIEPKKRLTMQSLFIITATVHTLEEIYSFTGVPKDILEGLIKLTKPN